jgi:tetratricopeptide (TPR) repeat protein
MDINKAVQSAYEYYQKGNLQQAETILKNILEVQPDHAIILYFLGEIYYQLGNYDSAIKYFKEVLRFNPANADAYYNMGISFKQKGQIDEAITCYQKAIELNPDIADVYNNMGLAFQEKGELDEAITFYQKALQINPSYAYAYYNLGNTLKEKGKLDEAITCYKTAIQLNPSIPDAYNSTGVAFQEKGQLDEAITFYQKALQLNADYSDAYYNLGNAFKDKEQPDGAIACYRRALQINPHHIDAYNNLGIVFQDKGQLEDAITCSQKALQLNPHDADAHWNMSLALLSSGNLKEGWKEYEWRSKVKDFCQRTFPQPLWDGTDIAGRTILIYAEQGLGDTIQFIRYVPFVAQRGAKVIFECQKDLKSLAQNVEGVQRVIAYGEQLPEFDVQCPLLSLPLVFDTTLESIPAKIPYIGVGSVLIQEWRERINHDNSKFKIGLVWAGGQRDKRERCRSFSLDAFLPFVQLGDVTFYSLQKGEAAKQTKNPPEGMKIIDYTGEIHDFSDTTAFIANLDLVISVDTAVAHLAGALGRPVWTLLPFSPDWRWLLNREGSLWYPTMRLFRQPSSGDWESVINCVKKELTQFMNDNLD